MKHKILWFDDKCNEFPNLPKIFDLHDLELIPCDTAEKFIHELNADSDNRIMAVILDYLDADMTPRCYAECKRQSDAKGLPIFTYSAQQSMIEKNDLFMAMIGREHLYDKGTSEDRKRLIADIKSMIASKEKNSIYVKEMHQNLFSAIGKIKDGNVEKHVLDFLRSYTFQEDRNLRPDAADFRKIYEPLFAFLRERGLLPTECFKTNGQPVQKDVLRYLKGEATRFCSGNICPLGVIDTKGPILPEQLAIQFDEIVNSANKEAHSDNSDPLAIISDYTLQKQFFELCGILIYLVHYSTAEDQRSAQMNRSRCFRYNKYSTETDSEGLCHLGCCLLEVPGENWNRYRLLRNTNEHTSECYPLVLKKIKTQSSSKH